MSYEEKKKEFIKALEKASVRHNKDKVFFRLVGSNVFIFKTGK